MSAPQLKIKDIMAMLEALPPKQLEEAKRLAYEGTKHMMWVPNLGPQSEAYHCTADQVLYGGSAGAGKSQLLLGKALQKHKRSLILRRLNKEVEYLVDATEAVVGHRDGYNGQTKRWHMPDDRLVIFGGCQHPGDEQGYKGEPKDFIGIDEASTFLESQVDFVSQWIRTADPNQATQLMLATNPPDTPEGEWIVNWFAPWVNPDHPLYPQPYGKLLYFERAGNEFRWSEEPFEITIANGKKVRSLSRTFIRAFLSDNPDYDNTDYAARLAAAPEELRARYERGEFVSDPIDDEFQVIKTVHVMAAQERWRTMDRQRPGPPENIAMTAMGADIAVSIDRTVLSPRYNTWFATQIVAPGKTTSEGWQAAQFMMHHLRDGAQINIDLGGGYGSSAYEYIKNNNFCTILGISGAESAMGKSVCGKFKFKNKRAEMYWRLREALDPNSGFNIALPPDPELKAELCAGRWRLGPASGGSPVIIMEEKDEIKKRLGRSPDKADSLVLSWYTGSHRMARAMGQKQQGAWRPPQGHTNQGRKPNRYDRHANRRAPTGGGWGGGGEQG